MQNVTAEDVINAARKVLDRRQRGDRLGNAHRRRGEAAMIRFLFAAVFCVFALLAAPR
ncbi:MAG: hypothetical protein R3D56_03945 [Paracoccaceae bacterium]